MMADFESGEPLGGLFCGLIARRMRAGVMRGVSFNREGDHGESEKSAEGGRIGVNGEREGRGGKPRAHRSEQAGRRRSLGEIESACSEETRRSSRESRAPL